MVRPTIFVRLSGRTVDSTRISRVLCRAGYCPSMLLERSDEFACWIEVEAPGSVSDIDAVRRRVERLVQGFDFTVREYGPHSTAALA